MNSMMALNHLCFFTLCVYILIERIECFISPNCNYNQFQSGCADRVGSECHKPTLKCVCKPEFSIRLGDFCLQRKYLGEKCFASLQCNHIPNAGCFNYREEFNQNPRTFFGTLQNMWPSGVCRCKVGHRFDRDSNTCVQRIIGSWCSNVWDCVLEDKRVVTAYVCEDNECKCNANYVYNQTTHDCHYKETYGNPCTRKDQCIHPTVCLNDTCDCGHNYFLSNEKSPKCQPNNNLNDIKSENSQDVAKGDKTFEIFILTVIPIVIIFLTFKPCMKRLGKCKPQTDEVICGSKEISIKCSDFNNDLAFNQHKFCEKLQTIEEVGEEIKTKEDENDVEVMDSCKEKPNEQKSIENISEDTAISMECRHSS